MVTWHHWLDGHEFEQAPGDGEGQGSLACCSLWGCKESNTTERLNNNNLKFKLTRHFIHPWRKYLSPYESNNCEMKKLQGRVQGFTDCVPDNTEQIKGGGEVIPRRWSLKEDLKVLEVRSRHRWKMSRKAVSWERILGRQVTHVKFLKHSAFQKW